MFKNLSIKWKLVSLVMVMLVAILAIGLAGFAGLRQVGSAMEEIGVVRLPSVEGLLHVSEGQTAVKAANLSVAIYENDYAAQKQFSHVLEQRRKAWSNIDTGWKKYEPLPQTAEEAVMWQQFESEWATWKRADAEIASIIEAMSRNTSPDKQKELFVEFFKHIATSDPLFLKAEETLNKIVDLNEAIAVQSTKEGNAAKSNAQWLMLIVAGIALAVTIPCAMYITASITGPLKEAVQIAQTVAAGDLTSQFNIRSKDETGQLLQALKVMNDSLVKIVQEVRTGTETIATASAQVAAGSQDLSSRTEQQASSLEETASSMEELTSTVKQNADNARQANSMATTASTVALKGGEVIGQVVSTMNEINASANKIVDIIGVIDGIAFQTNILALNAAVEAARAGEQGRGFAVVASEVRTLAQRSANAAKEIKSLIGDSVEKVESGSRQVNDAGTTMAEIVQSVKRVTDIMAEISAASAEQTSGIEQINQAVTEMDNVTQQNAALVEEAAAASESMQDQAAKLAQVVSVFKIASMGIQGTPTLAAPKVAHPVAAPVRKSIGHGAAPLSAAPAPKALAMARSGNDWEEF